MRIVPLLFAITMMTLSARPIHAQSDSLRLSLSQAEQQFVQKNFVLLAQKYNVNVAEAAKEQAKLWYNPNLFVETNLYN
ncbi:MAG TPA: TolC family protein, partial [Runella sp.]|nr:TolC family protein [Runella sp.]